MKRHVLLMLVAVFSVMGTLVTPIASADAGADLSVSAVWLGHGTPRVRAGDIVTWSVTVTNLGPDTATQVEIWDNEGDTFNLATSSCGHIYSICTVDALAPGQSRTVTFTAIANSFGDPPVRHDGVDGYVVSPTPDPNPDNNWAHVELRITGPIPPRPLR